MTRPRFWPMTLLALVGCSGPVFVMPGAALSGPVLAPPADFSFADDAGTIQLETSPTEPYSVNISCAVVDGQLLVNAGDTRTRWVQNIEADPRVRVRINGEIYELVAERVLGSPLLERFSEAWTSKHGWWARDPRKLDEVWIYHLRAI